MYSESHGVSKVTLQLKTTFWPGLTVRLDMTSASIRGGPHVLTGWDTKVIIEIETCEHDDASNDNYHDDNMADCSDNLV